jgi:hypothetical protein
MELITEQDKRKAFNAEWGIKEDAGISPPAWMTSQPMTATDFRNKADKHSNIADGLKSGDKKDSHNIASIKANKAADAIDAAHLASRKAEAFE